MNSIQYQVTWQELTYVEGHEPGAGRTLWVTHQKVHPTDELAKKQKDYLSLFNDIREIKIAPYFQSNNEEEPLINSIEFKNMQELAKVDNGMMDLLQQAKSYFLLKTI
ncbi:MAG TPA: hypothetical protein VFM18_17790 [Methanosarcina sp.]|nr:hypothetical protein [Methanosarcina sp.]